LGRGRGWQGLLCSSNIATVTMDRKHLNFMRRYPNRIPLSAKEVTAIGAALEPFAFNAIYGHFFDRAIAAGGKQVLRESVDRYIATIAG
jgi:hypothetical protein